MTSTLCKSEPAQAFDTIADSYDDLFTNSAIGRAQRAVVWSEFDRVFRVGDSILDLNCGTGEDAAHLAQRGVNVVGCDASGRMVELAVQKLRNQAPPSFTEFHVLASENLMDLQLQTPLDGALSNFAGLNCVSDLTDVASQLARILPPGAFAVLCMYSKFCIWELLFFALKGNRQSALRRLRKSQAARIGGSTVVVHYRTVSEVRRTFAPGFELCRICAVGLAIPPSYLEPWAAKHRGILGGLVKADGFLRRVPLLRTWGDHVLLTFKRREQ